MRRRLTAIVNTRKRRRRPTALHDCSGSEDGSDEEDLLD